VKLPRWLGLVLCLIAFPVAFAIFGMIGGMLLVAIATRGEPGPYFGLGFFGGALSGALAGVLLALTAYGPFGPRARPKRRVHAVNRYRSSAESYDLLHRAGWDVGDTVAGPDDARFWWVTGTNGDNVIDATGKTRAEAWHLAVEQARSFGTLGRLRSGG
jgi:hypothetical protein